jgi:hypothetical protein
MKAAIGTKVGKGDVCYRTSTMHAGFKPAHTNNASIFQATTRLGL